MKNKLNSFCSPNMGSQDLLEMDFSQPENYYTLYPWKIAINGIDKDIGRNTMIVLLKTKGLLNLNNKPNPKGMFINFFTEFSPSNNKSWEGPFAGRKVTFISGIGIHFMRKQVELIRKEGGSI